VCDEDSVREHMAMVRRLRPGFNITPLPI
jgi:hypothetical protein